MLLSVIIPAYNEENNILFSLKNILDFLNTKGFSYEVIVVDDGSKDDTYKIVSEFSGKKNNIYVIRNLKNEGKGSALKRGVLAAKGEYILFMDADYSTSIEELDKILPLLLQDNRYDFIIGSRHIKGANILRQEPLLRFILGKIYHYLVEILLLRGPEDFNCGFKLYRQQTAKDLFSRLSSKEYTFDVELLYLAKLLGYRYKEVPVTWQHKLGSKVRPFRDGIKSLFSLIKIKLNYRCPNDTSG